MYWKQAKPGPLDPQSLSSMHALKGALGADWRACWFILASSSTILAEAEVARRARRASLAEEEDMVRLCWWPGRGGGRLVSLEATLSRPPEAALEDRGGRHKGREHWQHWGSTGGALGEH